MAIRNEITTESWLEDLQYSLRLFARSDIEPLPHLQEYLASRYRPAEAASAMLSIRCACLWLSRNMEYLGEVGLRVSDARGNGFVGCLLMALHNLVFRDPDPEVWEKLPFTDPREVVAMAQEFIDAEKNPPTAPE